MLFKQYACESEQSGVRLFECRQEAFGVKLNCYAFAAGNVLIDTGSHSLRHHFRPFIDEVNPELVMITHHHEDHTGNASYCNSKGIPVLMNPLFRKECTEKANYPFYRRMFWGKRPAFQSGTLPEVIHSGRDVFKVISTPGHAADHVSFLNA